MVWNVIYAMKINKNYLNVIDAYSYVAQNVLINFILMKKANVQCVGYVDNILLVKKALISVFFSCKKQIIIMFKQVYYALLHVVLI